MQNFRELGVGLKSKMNGGWTHFRAGIFRGLGFSLVLLFLGIFGVAIRAYFPALRYRHAFMPKDDVAIVLNSSEKKTLNQLVSRGIVISAGDVYNDTLSYYNTLISWLIGLVGMSALVGFVYLRGQAGEEAERMAIKAADDFFSKETTHRLLEEKAIKAAEEGNEELEALREAVTKLGEKVELIESSSPRLPNVVAQKGENPKHADPDTEAAKTPLTGPIPSKEDDAKITKSPPLPTGKPNDTTKKNLSPESSEDA